MRTHDIFGRRVSVIGFGADFRTGLDEGRIRDLLDAYASIGGNLIDTARMYSSGQSERVIGRWLRSRPDRERFFIVTKGGFPAPDGSPRLSRQELRDDAARSRDALGLDRMDLWLLHRDDASRPVEDILETLQGIVEDGYAKAAGVSNWRPARIREAFDLAAKRGLAPPAANQLQFSLARQVVNDDPGLVIMDSDSMALHCSTGMPLFCFTSAAKGFLPLWDAGGEAALTEKARRRFLCGENLAVYARAAALREETGLSLYAISLGWLTSMPFPCFALAGCGSIERIPELAEAGSVLLTQAQRDALRTV